MNRTMFFSRVRVFLTDVISAITSLWPASSLRRSMSSVRNFCCRSMPDAKVLLSASVR
ncbi:hypothetical protein X777_04082 [Ooceraea biroi]|uniref:Uncharacterized protein n=1 Tax=Ooceraea biroi TaxID=2015173 RepID=A0A026WIQ9_OOCBI|nr:hypothetical protein X777_04082 [Ooceraea biroi]